jgi:cell division protein FtsL
MKKALIILGIIILAAAIAVGVYFGYGKWAKKKQSATPVQYFNDTVNLPPSQEGDQNSGVNKAQVKNSIYDSAKVVSIPTEDSKVKNVDTTLRPALYNMFFSDIKLIEVSENKLTYVPSYTLVGMDVARLSSVLAGAGYNVGQISAKGVEAVSPGKDGANLLFNFLSGSDGSSEIVVTF